MCPVNGKVNVFIAYCTCGAIKVEYIAKGYIYIYRERERGGIEDTQIYMQT